MQRMLHYTRKKTITIKQLKRLKQQLIVCPHYHQDSKLEAVSARILGFLLEDRTLTTFHDCDRIPLQVYSVTKKKKNIQLNSSNKNIALRFLNKKPFNV